MAKRKATPKVSPTKRTKTVPPPSLEELEKVFGPLQEANRALRDLNRPQRIVAPRTTVEELKAMAARLGYDPRALEEAEARYHAELLRLADERHAQAIKQSASVKERLGGAARAWTKGLQAVATVGDTISRFLLDRPLFISHSKGLTLDQSTIAPHNSTVKLHYHFVEPSPRGSSNESVSFLFHWVNPSPNTVTITADGYMVLNGTTRAVVNGFWPITESSRTTSFSLYTTLGVAALWTSPPTSVGGGLEQPVFVEVQTSGVPFVGYQHSAAVTTDVFKGVDVLTGQLAGVPLPPPQPIRVPANAAVALQLFMDIQTDVEGGSVDIDFSRGAFNVMTPGILITSLSSVPVVTV